MPRQRFKKGTRPKDLPTKKTMRQELEKEKRALAKKIAKDVGLKPAQITRVIERVSKPTEKAKLQRFRDVEVELLASARQKILIGFIEDAQKRGTILEYCQLLDKERLLRGESTQNLAALHILASAAEAAEMARIKGTGPKTGRKPEPMTVEGEIVKEDQ